MYISDNNNFATWQYSQKNSFVFVFSLWYLAPRSLALEVFKSPILLLLQLLQKVICTPYKMDRFEHLTTHHSAPGQFGRKETNPSPKIILEWGRPTILGLNEGGVGAG